MCTSQSGASSVDGTCCGMSAASVLSVTRGHRVATRGDPGCLCLYSRVIGVYDNVITDNYVSYV